MTLVEIEGKYVNPEHVAAVRAIAPDEDAGEFRTCVVLANGEMNFRKDVRQVVEALTRGSRAT